MAASNRSIWWGFRVLVSLSQIKQKPLLEYSVIPAILRWSQVGRSTDHNSLLASVRSDYWRFDNQGNQHHCTRSNYRWYYRDVLLQEIQKRMNTKKQPVVMDFLFLGFDIRCCSVDTLHLGGVAQNWRVSLFLSISLSPSLFSLHLSLRHRSFFDSTSAAV